MCGAIWLASLNPAGQALLERGEGFSLALLPLIRGRPVLGRQERGVPIPQLPTRHSSGLSIADASDLVAK
jgi:hypothetical protein